MRDTCYEGSTTKTKATTPTTTPPASLDNTVRLAAGGRHNCAIDAVGDVVCCGDNGYLQSTTS